MSHVPVDSADSARKTKRCSTKSPFPKISGRRAVVAKKIQQAGEDASQR